MGVEVLLPNRLPVIGAGVVAGWVGVTPNREPGWPGAGAPKLVVRGLVVAGVEAVLNRPVDGAVVLPPPNILPVCCCAGWVGAWVAPNKGFPVEGAPCPKIPPVVAGLPNKPVVLALPVAPCWGNRLPPVAAGVVVFPKRDPPGVCGVVPNIGYYKLNHLIILNLFSWSQPFK